ncbi:hypothetical protein IE53DRAFT_64531 [Violaceomyces palustris]|uniref:Uncharacterized protein n=1 Tax=Violaceomyces palustris TaxID=1673888 RepID=A0ACD0P782_9BASI|nr:hypothetical protein IE53DRAFT_64531 [Violaceomyces palustris]
MSSSTSIDRKKEEQAHGQQQPQPSSESSHARHTLTHPSPSPPPTQQPEPHPSSNATQPDSSDLIRQERERRAEVKRRKLQAELGFSSPGPAFLSSHSITDDDGNLSSSGAATPPHPSSISSSSSSSNPNAKSLRSSSRRSLTRASPSQPLPPPPNGSNLSGPIALDPAPAASSASPVLNTYSTKARQQQQQQRQSQRQRQSDRDQRTTLRKNAASPKSVSPIASTSKPSLPEAVSTPPPRATTRRLSRGSATKDQDAPGSDLASLPKPPIPTTTLLETMSFEEAIAFRREELLRCAQSELERVHSDHDMLVRELFHLTKFVTMIGYDPEIAQQDRSQVFSDFQLEYDLASKYAIGNVAGGRPGTSARATRRLMNARLEGLSLKKPEPPKAAKKPPVNANAARAREAAAAACADDEAEEENVGKRLRSAEKGKGREVVSNAAGNGGDLGHLDSPSLARERRFSGKKKMAAALRSAGEVKEEVTEVSRPLKRIRTQPARPPPLRVTAPEQAPRIQFNSSLSNFWSSFFLLGDEDMTAERLSQLEQSELDLYLRIDARRKDGTLPTEGTSTLARVPPKEPPRKKDHRAHMLEAVVSTSQYIRSSSRARIQMARKVSRMVQSYWEKKLGTSERERKAEEKRLRALAKWTVREVSKQWKLAVNVVRARKAAIARAHKEKLGKEQLNAILEKSTQMLELQHAEMTREASESEQSNLHSESEEEEDLSDMEEYVSEEDGDRTEEVEGGHVEGATEDDQERPGGKMDSQEAEDQGSVDALSEDSSHHSGRYQESERQALLAALVSDQEDGDQDRTDEEDGDDDGRPVTADEDRMSESSLGGIQTPPPPPPSPSPYPPRGELSQGAVPGTPSDEGLASGPGSPILQHHSFVNGSGQGHLSTQGGVDGDEELELEAKSMREATSASSPAREPCSSKQAESEPEADVKTSEPTVPERPEVDGDDVEFTMADDDQAGEDEDLERRMWEEDEEDESEDEGLAADAEIPIEELLKRYGYGRAADEDDDNQDDDDASMEEGDGHTNGKDGGNVGKTPAGSPRVVQVNKEAGAEEERASTDLTDAELRDGHGSGSGADPTQKEQPIMSDSDNDSLTDEDESSISKAIGRRQRSATRASSAISSDRHGPKSRQPFLLRGNLRPYQQIGFDWLAGLYANGVNGILADEMGLGKTIQTISLLAHLACDKGVWGPHLVIAPTSVMLNWEVEFKKFLPGFKILSYYGSQKERKEKRVGWNTENSFHVCITSYQLVLADQHIFRRKPWVYMILDEAHHIKNFRSQRWQTLLGFNSQRRLLLTGTPLQNNLMDLWSLMYFLMPHGVADIPGGGAFANMKDFQDWFSNPLDKAIEGGGQSIDDETRAMIAKLHTVLRPYLLRRLKSDVERELPRKYEHVITCRLSKRQRFLYNDFMSRAKTRESLASGNYLSIINCLMQLRKVCNHPDLFEVRPIVTSFAMQRSVAADFEIKELLVRRRILNDGHFDKVDLNLLNLEMTSSEQHLTPIITRDIRKLDASSKLPFVDQPTPAKVALDTWTLEGFQRTREQRRHVEQVEKWKHVAYVNRLRCSRQPIYGRGLISLALKLGANSRILPAELNEPDRRGYLNRCDAVGRMVHSNLSRRIEMQDLIDRFACVTPRATATDLPKYALAGFQPSTCPEALEPGFDTLHPVAVKLHIAFPDASLLQYDCGKLQQLDVLMRKLKEGGHRILIFTQMTKVLDILESFLNYHGYRYLRLDGATKVEQRQVLTEKFNRDLRIDAFILSTRSGGLGINLTGADTVLFYDLDWNAAIEAQCMDRAHRIGQTRDVHIYRFVSEHTIEENMLRKANQKRLLDSMVIQEGEFNTEALMRNDWRDMLDEGGTLAGVEVGSKSIGGGSSKEIEKAFLEAEDEEDAKAARMAQSEIHNLDVTDFAAENVAPPDEPRDSPATPLEVTTWAEEEEEEEEEQGGSIDDYMLKFVERDWDFFA